MANMTTSAARREAKRRWGAGGFATCPDGIFQVGCGAIRAGDGYSWEEAFAAADKDVWIAGYAATQRMCDKAVTR